MEGETEDLMKKHVTCDCVAVFCMSKYTSLYCAMRAFDLCLNFRLLYIKYSTSKDGGLAHPPRKGLFP
jgi:hypothetical protein